MAEEILYALLAPAIERARVVQAARQAEAHAKETPREKWPEKYAELLRKARSAGMRILEVSEKDDDRKWVSCLNFSTDTVEEMLFSLAKAGEHSDAAKRGGPGCRKFPSEIDKNRSWRSIARKDTRARAIYLRGGSLYYDII
jgi:hypothetical protein